MNESSQDVMALLRASTRSEHDRAEHHPFQQALFRGGLPRGEYVAWLGQMYLVHLSLETALRSAADDSAPIRQVVHGHQYQVPYLVEDLNHFGVDPETIEPLPATRRFVERIERRQEDPLWLLGLHYVLEGSNNGSRYIARSVAKAYGLDAGPGLRYLDPYGDRQPELWESFKRSMSRVGFNESECSRLVAAAKEMFSAIGELGDTLTARSTPTPASRPVR